MANMILSMQRGGDQEIRKISIWGPIGDGVARSTVETLISLAESDPLKPVEVWINSPGGSITSMFAIYDVMKYMPCPVHTIGLGEIMSAAVLLLAAGSVGCRSVLPHARVMIHQVSYGSMGTLTDMNTMHQEAKYLQQQYMTALTKNTAIDKTTLEEIIANNTDKYLAANAAVKMGIVDFVRK